MKNGQLQATGDYKEIELKYPHIVAKWQTVIAKVNQQAEEEESNVAAAGRTARERWKLYQNVAKLGLQRTKSSKVVATKIKAKAKINNARTELREIIVLDMNEGVGGDMASIGDAVVAITGREVGLAAFADKADDMTTAAVVMDNVAEFEEVEAVEDEDDDDDDDDGNGDDDSNDEDNEDEEEDLMPV
ncbi:PREDICTED: phosphopantothenoylcysteine decarboxylase subunit VHS3-like, partial [Rhagoletis zephyria]|uniref:phosphopantothenoylcysteine decarboxylase subunit VHS3-like n=1 Tax=Rhagoletis zephyria TaxID=28612 RepID=UPI0008114751